MATPARPALAVRPTLNRKIITNGKKLIFNPLVSWYFLDIFQRGNLINGENELKGRGNLY